ncbi:hypothetical protein DSM104635_02923 [Terricaulis silvestris]|uniref:Uncharacterized protein n=1 Tax=Terricaulis silvestris TaxID=2686094 RepID=A0A6I6MTG4_9CAUL|nr:hypothetical protein DSM104635_02923 [Terricaulis silvestris]
MKGIFSAVAVFLAVSAGFPPAAHACAPPSYDTPFIASARTLNPDGTWRTVRISAYGFDEDQRNPVGSMYWLRIEAADARSSTGHLAAILDIDRGSAQLFPSGRARSAADRVYWVSSMQAAATQFGLSTGFIDPDRAWDTEYPGGPEIRRYANRPCAFHTEASGAWSCFDQVGVPLAMGPRVGEISFRVVWLREEQQRSTSFAVPSGYVRLERPPASMQGVTC